MVLRREQSHRNLFRCQSSGNVASGSPVEISASHLDEHRQELLTQSYSSRESATVPHIWQILQGRQERRKASRCKQPTMPAALAGGCGLGEAVVGAALRSPLCGWGGLLSAGALSCGSKGGSEGQNEENGQLLIKSWEFGDSCQRRCCSPSWPGC